MDAAAFIADLRARNFAVYAAGDALYVTPISKLTLGDVTRIKETKAAILAVLNAPTKALSIRQPWAWAIFHAGKDIENRDWPTKLRGKIAVHAAKGMKRDEYDSAVEFILNANPAMKRGDVPKFDEMVLGAIVGTVKITDCVKESDSPWFMGDYGFCLQERGALSEPIHCKGALGFWDVPAGLLQSPSVSTASVAPSPALPMPSLHDGSLHIGFDCDPLFQWWKPEGQSLAQTLADLDAPADVIRRYLGKSDAPLHTALGVQDCKGEVVTLPELAYCVDCGRFYEMAAVSAAEQYSQKLKMELGF